jgi:hypothetical protein
MDTHKHVLTSGKIETGLDLDGTGYSETIKGSNMEQTGAIGFSIIAGNEDGIDCVRGTDYTFTNGVIESRSNTRTFITAKGGIDGLLLKDILLAGKTKWWRDIGLGDHTIYNKGKLMGMRNVVIDNVRRSDGKKVNVFVMDCDKPKCVNGRYRVIKLPKLLVKLFMKIKG